MYSEYIQEQSLEIIPYDLDARCPYRFILILRELIPISLDIGTPEPGIRIFDLIDERDSRVDETRGERRQERRGERRQGERDS